MAIFGRLKKPSARVQAAALHDAVVAASRQPAFFGEGRVPDTLLGRLELLTLHASLCLLRLQMQPDAEALTQRFTDTLFRSLDAGLREAGVGDLTVPKKMRRIAERFYGRLNSYGAALRDPEGAALASAIGRIIWQDATHPFAIPLAQHMRASHAHLQSRGLEDLALEATWRAPMTMG